MEWLKRVTLAAFRWAGEKLRALFDTVYDPPPRTIRFFFWSFIVILALSWGTFAFVNSWFYQPAVSFMTTLGDDGDVLLPEDHTTFLPEVVTPLPEIKPTLVCEDMSDTPHCVPVYESAEKRTVATQTEASVNQPAVAKPKLQKKAKRKVRKVNTVSPQDYFCAGFQC
jgi:hypothetical protein